MAASRFAGIFNANEYNYGGPGGPPALVVNTANAATGSGTLLLEFGQVALTDGTKLSPLNTNAPISVGIGTNAETVTPSAVSVPTPDQYGVSSVTATYANIHGTGDLIASGTVGLQEAINAAAAAGGGTVVVDGRWTLNGGTTAIIAAATLPANGSVSIDDNRSGAGAIQTATVTIPNAAVKTLFSVGSLLLPAPGAGNMIEVINMVVENVFLTAAYAAGGAIQATYGTTGVVTPATATIAATFLTSPVANQIIKVAGVIASSLSTVLLNKAISLTAATADFTTGAGSLIVKISYRVHTGLV